MAGRIRSIKPEWVEDERLNACSDTAIRMSFVLFALVDDDGRCRASVRALGLAAWKFCDHVDEKTDRAQRALDELVSCRWLVRYEADGYDHWQIRTWAKHQKIDKYKPSKLPPPPFDERSRPLATPREDSSKAREDSQNHETIEESGDSRQVATARDKSRMVAMDRDHGSGSGSGSMDPRVSEPVPRVTHSDVTALYSRLRSEAHQAKTGHPGGTYRRTTRDWQPVEDLAAWASEQPEPMAALEDSLRGYLADDWASGAGWPISAWAKDPGRYNGRLPARGVAYKAAEELERCEVATRAARLAYEACSDPEDRARLRAEWDRAKLALGRVRDTIEAARGAA